MGHRANKGWSKVGHRANEGEEVGVSVGVGVARRIGVGEHHQTVVLQHIRLLSARQPGSHSMRAPPGAMRAHPGSHSAARLPPTTRPPPATQQQQKTLDEPHSSTGTQTSYRTATPAHKRRSSNSSTHVVQHTHVRSTQPLSSTHTWCHTATPGETTGRGRVGRPDQTTGRNDWAGSRLGVQRTWRESESNGEPRMKWVGELPRCSRVAAAEAD